MPPRRIVNRPEENLQLASVDFLNSFAVPPAQGGAVWWHTPNQRGTRSAFENALMKRMGVKAGMVDLAFLHDSRFLGTDLKSATGGLSKSQRATQAELVSQGAIILPVCRSVAELALWLDARAVPLRMGSAQRANFRAAVSPKFLEALDG